MSLPMYRKPCTAKQVALVEVWRTDDNGNDFRVDSVGQMPSVPAQHLIDLWNKSIHKQTYWLKRVGD